MMPNRTMPAPIISPVSFSRFSPIFIPMKIVVPIARPVITAVSACIIQLPVEIAVTSASVPNQPTIIISTAPYIVCRKSERSTGSANIISEGRILPSVKLLIFFMTE